ncbi:tRNA (adenosine(37)-N6)-dimethylallyltransferase MiaA [Candidatus Falkowbacteria bacterium]|nr:tRNA (adenosine(37)-N6)-dimethylallyltransferase MiaA [Candidatus Falkowbacteria bacterium]
MKDNKNKVIVILGTTASGKTGLGVRLAHGLGGEIISADSRQVYKGMDIGTGKDLAEYEIDGQKIAYHLIDVADPKERYSLADFQKEAFAAIDDILKRGQLPIIVGGTGQYLEAVVENYKLSDAEPNKELREKLEKADIDEIFAQIKEINSKFASNINESDRKNKRRLIRYLEVLQASGGDFEPLRRPQESQYDFLMLGLTHPKEILSERIDKRLEQRLEEEGMVEEVQELNRNGLSFERLEEFGLEYKYISKYLKDELEYEEMKEKLAQEIKKFAKKQMTWYKRWEKRGRKIHWVEDKDDANNLIENFLGKNA